jgi:hypothetical protein
MGYNIEISFNLIKNSSVSYLQDKIVNLATKFECLNWYEEYEYETHVKYQRKHCIIIFNFNNSQICNIVNFLDEIKKSKEFYIEVIYDDDSNKIIYTSKYYRTQKMEKPNLKKRNEDVKTRIYSDEEIKIIESMKKIK